MKKLGEKDWIILRLLFLLTVNDPTVSAFPDVQKTYDYLRRKYKNYKEMSEDALLRDAFALLVKEHRELDTFNKAKETKIHRELSRSIDIQKQHENDLDSTDYVQWRCN